MLSRQQARQVVATATAAPSVHNSQPWLFAVRPDCLLVLPDRSRTLPRQDPHGRELLISCGAACLHAELAVRFLRLTGAVALLPSPDVVATIATDAGPVPSRDELRLLGAVPRRHTDRSPFADWPVERDLLDVLVQAAEAEQAWLRVLSTVDMLELAWLQAHAQAALLDDPQAQRERAAWARSEPLAADGLPADLVRGSWCAPGVVRGSTDSITDVVLVLGTEEDDPLSWVRAGRALARVLLEATDAGLVAAPATLALEMPTVRDALRGVLALHGAPQMVLRTGYPAGLGSPRTGRRDVQDVLVQA